MSNLSQRDFFTLFENKWQELLQESTVVSLRCSTPVLDSNFINCDSVSVLSISTDGRRKASATCISLREIGDFSPKLK